MLDLHFRRPRRDSLLQRYGNQLGHIVKQNLTEQALIAATQKAERSAEVTRIALLHAEAANSAKTDFLANMSHELRTPLNAIIGFSDVIRNELLGPVTETPRYLSYAKDINDAGSHLLAVINDILDIAKIEAGQLDLDETVFDLRESVETCLTMLHEQAVAAGLELLFLGRHDITPLEGDENKFRQIMINLISNAIKFTPEGGRITVEIDIEADGRLRVVVADTGIGIAPENLEKVMEPFTQVDSSLARKFVGTGLGLPISRALAKLHGGTLELTSGLGEGSTVIVHLPAHRLRTQLSEMATR